jgi:hypothetical protein
VKIAKADTPLERTKTSSGAERMGKVMAMRLSVLLDKAFSDFARMGGTKEHAEVITSTSLEKCFPSAGLVNPAPPHVSGPRPKPNPPRSGAAVLRALM